MRIAVIAVFFPLAVGAQERPNSVFWRITRAGASDTSYVLGTVHSADARAFTHAVLPLSLIPGLDAVVGELDMDQARDEARTSLAEMSLPKGKYLDDLYSKKEYERLMAKLKEEIGAAAYIATSLKPFFVMSLVADSIMKKDSAMVLDDYLQHRGRALGKQILGLEKMRDQSRAVDRIPLKEQAQMLLDMADHDFQRDDLEKMMNAYAAQDLSALEESFEKDQAEASMDEALLDERNPNMAKEMDRLMQSGLTCLFAIGAAHLPGSGGVVLRLRSMGYEVEPVH